MASKKTKKVKSPKARKTKVEGRKRGRCSVCRKAGHNSRTCEAKGRK